MKIAVANWNGVTTDLTEELKKRGHKIYTTLNQRDKGFLKEIDALITWNEVHEYGNDKFIEKVNSLGVKTFLVQHGRRGTSRIYPPFNEKLVCQKALLWGENDRKRLIECGNPPERLFVTGTPIFRHLKPRVKHSGINVVFSPEHWGMEVPENNMIASVLRKIDGVNIITKALKGEHDLKYYDNVIVSDRNTPEHWPIVADVLSKADVVVALSESTFELLAESLDIPVVVADIWIPKPDVNGDKRYLEYHREYSNACTRVRDITKLADAIKYAIKHPEYLREERAKIIIDDGGTNIKDPVGEMIKLIEGK